ncbi:class I SAM-dependent methyltransferase [Polynucleobacter sp. Ross1-W9]|uniref:class I SAM-dependent methyltransferase n=1 Tax=Polynucleobacter parvulilacunae TaxID=1855631 RepID=UPI001C0D555D|nr:class I SAM-dependent methyltransferase [Polynucleobacter parvulilacunae]MBU3556842.1 class I SAM-dependent methyltransferase [Polynucleobacter parvulilacunae]
MNKESMSNKWPKTPPQLTEKQKEIGDDWLKYWLSLMPGKYGAYAKFNHEYVIKNAPAEFESTLEIGCGDGEHLNFEKLNEAQEKKYVAIDIRQNIVDAFKRKHSKIQCYVSDCQARQNFENNSFDRILAIHVLEHLPNLPAAVDELYRLCNKERGVLSIVLPCEGSLAYTFARKISAERMFKKRYKMPYDWYMKSEHINTIDEVLEELSRKFIIQKSTFFPLKIKIREVNLAIGYTLTPI